MYWHLTDKALWATGKKRQVTQETSSVPPVSAKNYSQVTQLRWKRQMPVNLGIVSSQWDFSKGNFVSKEEKKRRRKCLLKHLIIWWNIAILSSFETFKGIVRYSLVWKMTTTLMKSTAKMMVIILMITVLKICELTKKTKAIMKTIKMMRLVSHHTGVRVIKNRWWVQLIFGFVHF